jgi:hypothetical protein
MIAPAAEAQHYYPAGIGNSNLQLWLTAADATTLLNHSGAQAASGDSVAQWKDKSGNGHHATQTSGSGLQPVTQSNQLNGHGAVLFQNAGQYMLGPSGGYQTVIAVRNMPGTGHYQTLFASQANTDNISIRGGGTTSGSASSYTDGPNSNDWTVGTGSTSANWINGVQTLTGNTVANHILVASAAAPTNSTYSLNSTFLSRGMNGNDAIFELLSYNTMLNKTQRQLLENYEAQIWGLGAALPATGYPLYTAPSANTFNTNLVGIGSNSSTDHFLSNAAGTTDGLGFTSGTGSSDFLSIAGFIMAAHNGQVNTTQANLTIPGFGTGINRWTRSWNMEKTGGNASGNITLSFNFNDYNGSSLPSGSPSYGLIFNSSDGTFATGTNTNVSVASVTSSGSTVTIVVKVSNLSNGYYTLAWSTSVVLPVELLSFEVQKQDAGCLATWTSISETNNSYFEIQRSTNGISFTDIGRVYSSGIPLAATTYTFKDLQPSAGINNYRLKMVDMDGDSGYSAIRSVAVTGNSDLQMEVYPNPATDILRVSLTNSTGVSIVRLFNLNGQMIREAQADLSSPLQLSIKDIASGMYVLQVTAGSAQYVRKINKY